MLGKGRPAPLPGCSGRRAWVAYSPGAASSQDLACELATDEGERFWIERGPAWLSTFLLQESSVSQIPPPPRQRMTLSTNIIGPESHIKHAEKTRVRPRAATPLHRTKKRIAESASNSLV